MVLLRKIIATFGRWFRVAGPVLLCGILLVPVDLGGQLDSPRPGGLYASVGLGFVSLKKGVGIGLPAGCTAVLAPYRLIASVNVVDLGLFEGEGKDPRYQRIFLPGRPPGCWDRETGRQVPSHWCSGGTDALNSFSADLSYVAVDSLWVGNRPGRLFAGLGCRFLNPRTLYGTVGLYFDSSSRRAVGIKGAFSKDYMYIGLTWGLNLRRR